MVMTYPIKGIGLLMASYRAVHVTSFSAHQHRVMIVNEDPKVRTRNDYSMMFLEQKSQQPGYPTHDIPRVAIGV
jgi:hypothetical protein